MEYYFCGARSSKLLTRFGLSVCVVATHNDSVSVFVSRITHIFVVFVTEYVPWIGAPPSLNVLCLSFRRLKSSETKVLAGPCQNISDLIIFPFKHIFSGWAQADEGYFGRRDLVMEQIFCEMIFVLKLL